MTSRWWSFEQEILYCSTYLATTSLNVPTVTHLRSTSTLSEVPKTLSLTGNCTTLTKSVFPRAPTMNEFYHFLSFVVGAAIGAALVWYFKIGYFLYEWMRNRKNGNR